MQLLEPKLVGVLLSLTSGSLPVFIQTHKDQTRVLQEQLASWFKTRSKLRHQHQKTQRHKETSVVVRKD